MSFKFTESSLFCNKQNVNRLTFPFFTSSIFIYFSYVDYKIVWEFPTYIRSNCQILLTLEVQFPSGVNECSWKGTQGRPRVFFPVSVK